jgi:hypothetical protein
MGTSVQLHAEQRFVVHAGGLSLRVVRTVPGIWLKTVKMPPIEGKYGVAPRRHAARQLAEIRVKHRLPIAIVCARSAYVASTGIRNPASVRIVF